jgi:DNA-binding NarL/FixJ family response regulator
MDDVEEDASNLSLELKKKKAHAQICTNVNELLAFAANMDAGMFVIDLDMGENRRREGLEAIKKLRAICSVSDTPESYYIAALTTHSEMEQEAVQAGAHTFLVKGNAKTDALELLLRLSAHTIAVERRWADPIQKELANREYDNLKRQLTTLKRTKVGLTSCISTVRRALNWPFLSENEQVVLACLDEQLRMTTELNDIDIEVVDFCIDGLEILMGVHRLSIKDWIHMGQKHSRNTLFPWLEGDEFDDPED